MRADEQRFPLALQLTHQLLELDTRLRIQPRRGFIHHQEIRVAYQHARQRQALRLPLGKLIDVARAQGIYAAEAQHTLHLLHSLAATQPISAGKEVDIIMHSRVVDGVETIRHPTNASAHFFRICGCIYPGKDNIATIRQVECGQQAHGRGFTGTIGANQAN